MLTCLDMFKKHHGNRNMPV